MLRCTIIFPKSRSVQSHTPFVRVSVCIGRWRHPRSCLGCALQLARALPICTHHGNKNTAKIERGNSQKWTKLQMETGKPPQFCHLFIVTYSSPLFFFLFSDLGAIWRAGFELACTLAPFVTTPPPSHSVLPG